MNTCNVSAIAVSAISAYVTRLNITENNVANMNSESFKPPEAAMDAGTGGRATSIFV